MPPLPPIDDAVREQIVRDAAARGLYAAITASGIDPIAVMRLQQSDAGFAADLELAEELVRHRITGVLLGVLGDREAPLRERVSIGKQLLREGRPRTKSESRRRIADRQPSPADDHLENPRDITSAEHDASADASRTSPTDDWDANPDAASNIAATLAALTDPITEPGVPLPFRRTVPRVGRNDPCPCGSGRKAKRCCLIRDG